MPTSTRSPAGSGFSGFPPEALLFYEGLEADNSRAYWSDHLTTYEESVRAPMLALIADLEAGFGGFKVFRPYRDVRFSHDKSPYKTHIGAVTAAPVDGVSWYVQVSAEGLLVAGGCYRPSRDQLERFRAAVLDDVAGEQLAALTDRLAADGYPLEGETLKRAPRGVPADHPRVHLLRRKSFAAFRDFGAPDWLDSPAVRDEVAAAFRRLTPFTQWLARHVGAPEPAEGDVPARAGRS